jgi:hypothetical protein
MTQRGQGAGDPQTDLVPIMLAQSAVSLALVLVVARAVNTLA